MDMDRPRLSTQCARQMKNTCVHGCNTIVFCTTVTLLAGCGAQTLAGAPPTAPQSALPGTRADLARSRVAPESKSENLLYISDDVGKAVYIFPYPQGKLLGKLTGFQQPGGMCVDKLGDVWVTSATGYSVGAVVEYRHGGASPIKRLKNNYPFGCSVDPNTGGLAVTEGNASTNGVVWIYPMGKGNPKVYRDSRISGASYCGYDDKGNLFIDGFGGSSDNFIFFVLPKGSSKFKIIKLDRSVEHAGGVQWDGKYVAIGDEGAGLVYRADPATGKVADTVTLDSGVDVRQFWIQGSTIIGPPAGHDGVGFWHYPAGGFPIRIMKGFDGPAGAVVSLAQ